MLARKRTGLATSCVFDCHIGPNIFTSHIFASASHLCTRIASSHLRISDPHISGCSYLTSSYPHMVASQIFVSCIVLRHICALSHLRSSHLRSSYAISLSSSGLHILKPHLVFTTLGLHDVVTLSYLIKIFKISLSYIYNLIYLRLQNLISLNIISPLSGQPSSSLFFSILAQPSSHEKRARCNPSQGKCVFRAKKCQKLRVFCDFFFGATLCGNPAVECQKLRVFCEFFLARCTPLRENEGQVSKTEGFLRFWCARKCDEDCADDSFCYIRPFFRESKNERKSPKNVKN